MVDQPGDVGEPTYADLDELFTDYVDLLATLPGVEDLTPLAREVRLASVQAALQERDPAILDPQDSRFPLFLEALNGAAGEVEVLVGLDPQPSTRRRLALRAIALATAADIEESLFPEQQIGDTSRAAYLRRRYDAVMAAVAGTVDPTTGVVEPLRPRGSFPPPPGCYPDPAERYRRF